MRTIVVDARRGNKVNVAILGRPHEATILEHASFDPERLRLS